MPQPLLLLQAAVPPLATSLAVLLYRSGNLGEYPLSLQIAVSLIILACIPLLRQLWNKAPPTIKNTVGLPLIFIFIFTTAFPLLYKLFVNLLTGHRQAGAQWYSSVWRIYVILAIWIGLAWLFENIVKPYWNESRYADLFSGSEPLRPVAVAADQLQRNRRDEAVAAVYSKIEEKAMGKVRAKRERDQIQMEVERLKQELKDISSALEQRARKIEDEPNAQLESIKLEMLRNKSETIKDRIDSKQGQISYLSLTIKAADEALDDLKEKWHRANDLETHKRFYR